jgi:hypothetical protein
MSEHKHTPGPWQVNHEDPTQVCDADGEVRGCSPIAHCTVGTMAERKANAKLIAAAPEMLAALLAMQAFIEGEPDAVEPFGLIRAAIAKATGGEA